MTDRFNYQDVLQTINIPETERHYILEAKELLDSARGVDWNPQMHQHLQRVAENPGVTQAFWEFENDTEFQYDRFVITAARRGLTLAVEHRSFNRTGDAFRSSLHLENTAIGVYSSNLLHSGRLSEKLTDPNSLIQFGEQFTRVTANLGLSEYIRSIRTANQSESDAASLASAA